MDDVIRFKWMTSSILRGTVMSIARRGGSAAPPFPWLEPLMDVTVDGDLTDYHASDWKIVLEFAPSSNAASLSWSPENLCDPQTIPVHVSRHPLTQQQINAIVRTVRTFEKIDTITGARWTYLHNQNRSGWQNADDLADALDNLREQISDILM